MLFLETLRIVRYRSQIQNKGKFAINGERFRGVNKVILYEQVRIKSMRQTINEVR